MSMVSHQQYFLYILLFWIVLYPIVNYRISCVYKVLYMHAVIGQLPCLQQTKYANTVITSWLVHFSFLVLLCLNNLMETLEGGWENSKYLISAPTCTSLLHINLFEFVWILSSTLWACRNQKMPTREAIFFPFKVLYCTMLCCVVLRCSCCSVLRH